MGSVTISIAEYQDLLDSQFFLQCLENAGVNNWDGYDYAIEEYNREKEIND